VCGMVNTNTGEHSPENACQGTRFHHAAHTHTRAYTGVYADTATPPQTPPTSQFAMNPICAGECQYGRFFVP